jgi:hypothetical protein
VEAAKPVKEGLSEQQLVDVLGATQAQEVRQQGHTTRGRGGGGCEPNRPTSSSRGQMSIAL